MLPCLTRQERGGAAVNWTQWVIDQLAGHHPLSHSFTDIYDQYQSRNHVKQPFHALIILEKPLSIDICVSINESDG